MQYMKVMPYLVLDHNEKLWIVAMYIPLMDCWYVFPDYTYHYSFNGIYNYLKAPLNEHGKAKLLQMLKVFFHNHKYTKKDIELLYSTEAHNFYSGYEELSEYKKFEIGGIL